MKWLRVTSIREGDCYPQAVFLPRGQKVIPPNTPITARHIRILLRQSAAQVVLADSADEVAAAAQPVSPTVEPPATVTEPLAPQDIPAPDPQGERARLRKQRMARADDLIEQLRDRAAQVTPHFPPEQVEIWDRRPEADCPWLQGEQLAFFREKHVDALRDLYAAVEAGQDVHVDAFAHIIDALWPLLLHHRARFTQLALLVERRDDYLPDHAMCVAVLAMATAAQLTWSEAHVRQAGLAALTCDMGMLLIPQRIRIGGEQLSDIDRGRVQRHTVYSVAMLDAIQGVADVIRLAAWQHHERENGSGYPQSLRGEAICDLARVIAVADVFAALTSPRHYRRNRLPYVAMEQMVRSAAAGQFYKPATRALVQAAGLFPVGSYVKLSDDRIARVLAANANHLDRPVVQPINDAGEATGPATDLSGMPANALAVVRPVAGPLASAQPAGA